MIRRTLLFLSLIIVCFFSSFVALLGHAASPAAAQTLPDSCEPSSPEVEVGSARASGSEGQVEIGFRLKHPPRDNERGKIPDAILWGKKINSAWQRIAVSPRLRANEYQKLPVLIELAVGGKETSYQFTHKTSEEFTYVAYGQFEGRLYKNCSSPFTAQSTGGQAKNTIPPCPNNIRVLEASFTEAKIAWDFKWENGPPNPKIRYQVQYWVNGIPEFSLPETQMHEKTANVFYRWNNDKSEIKVLAINSTTGQLSQNCKSIFFINRGQYIEFINQNGESGRIKAKDDIEPPGEPPGDETSVGPDIGDDPFPKSLAEYIVDPKGFVHPAWRVTRGLINLLLIVGLLLISFSNILRLNLDIYLIKKALPNLVLGVVLANASFFIIRYLIDIATVATYLFVHLSGRVGQDAFQQFVIDVAQTIGAETIEAIGAIAGALSSLIVPILGLVTVVGLLWLSFLLYFRLVAIYLLTILSPLAFIAYGIPGLEKYFKMWWQQMIKWLFMVPAMVVIFWLMIEIDKATPNSSIAKLLIMYVLFFLACTIPSRFGGAVIDKASGVFKKYSGADYAKQKLGEAGQDMKERAGLRWQQAWRRAPIGKQLATYAEKRALDKENMKKDVELLRQEAATRTRRGRAGLNEAALADREQTVADDLADIKAENMDKYWETPKGKEALTAAIRSEFKKRAAEAKRDNLRMETKIKFMDEKSNENEEDKKLIESVYKHVFNQKRSSDQLELDDSILIGNVAEERIQGFQVLENYNKHEKELERAKGTYGEGSEEYRAIQAMMEREKDAYKALRQKPEYAEDFGNLDFEEAREKFKTDKIWQATHSRGKKIYNEGISKQNELLLKEGSEAEITAEIRNIESQMIKQFGDIGAKAKMKLLLEGNTAQLMAELDVAKEEAEKAGDSYVGPKMRDINVAAHLQKSIMARPGDYRNRGVLKNFLDMYNEVADVKIDYTESDLNNRQARAELGRRAVNQSGVLAGPPSSNYYKGGHFWAGKKGVADAPPRPNIPVFSKEDIAAGGNILPKEEAPLTREDYRKSYHEEHGIYPEEWESKYGKNAAANPGEYADDDDDAVGEETDKEDS